MTQITLINQMLPGKLVEYKEFLAELVTKHKEEYRDMLNRYGLTNSKVLYQKLDDVEFAVVMHEIEPHAFERLAGWTTSTHPFDIWFKNQSKKYYDVAAIQKAGHAQLILDFK